MNLEQYGLGYVVSEFPEGLLIWSNIDGGLLSFIRKDKHKFVLPRVHNVPENDLYVPPIAITGLRGKPRPGGSKFASISFQGSALHQLDQKMAEAYFPSFLVNGIMTCILGNEIGSMLAVRWCAFDTLVYKNRPFPKSGDKVYCPSWSFVDGTVLSQWQENCRFHVDYICRCVFVRCTSTIYGCNWIALAVKQKGMPSLSECLMPYHQDPSASRRVALKESYDQILPNITAWTPDAVLERLLVQMEMHERLNAIGGRRNNCSVLKTFLRDIETANPPTSGNRVNTSGYSMGFDPRKKRMVDSGTQTIVDTQFLEEIQSWFPAAAAACRPEHRGEFWARISKEQHVTKVSCNGI